MNPQELADYLTHIRTRQVSSINHRRPSYERPETAALKFLLAGIMAFIALVLAAFTHP